MKFRMHTASLASAPGKYCFYFILILKRQTRKILQNVPYRTNEPEINDTLQYKFSQSV